MALFNANILMRELRIASGLTQEQVAEGICARQTISAIETGNRKPDIFIFANVLKKLNVNPAHYCSDIANDNEIYIYNKLNLINKTLNVFDYDGIKTQIETL